MLPTRFLRRLTGFLCEGRPEDGPRMARMARMEREREMGRAFSPRRMVCLGSWGGARAVPQAGMGRAFGPGSGGMAAATRHSQ
jgi:hypothetical protein